MDPFKNRNILLIRQINNFNEGVSGRETGEGIYKNLFHETEFSQDSTTADNLFTKTFTKPT